jgi:hypothetical protein
MSPYPTFPTSRPFIKWTMVLALTVRFCEMPSVEEACSPLAPFDAHCRSYNCLPEDLANMMMKAQIRYIHPSHRLSFDNSVLRGPLEAACMLRS